MDRIEDMKVVKLENSNYVKPIRLHYKQDQVEKIWDMVLTHSCVFIILFNVTRRKLVFVQQFRPTVYFASIRRGMKNEVKVGDTLDTSLASGRGGVTLELCAGIIDKEGKSAHEIAQEEIMEECGYEVPLDKIEEVHTCYASIGIGGENLSYFYAEVTDEMKTGKGGGVDTEVIDVVEMSVEETREYLNKKSVNTTPATLYGMMWFLANKV